MTIGSALTHANSLVLKSQCEQIDKSQVNYAFAVGGEQLIVRLKSIKETRLKSFLNWADREANVEHGEIAGQHFFGNLLAIEVETS